MMTRKHFIAFAEAVAKIKDESNREYVASLIGTVLAEDNPRFDWERFHKHIRACV